MKKLFKITSIILVQTFLVFDSVCAFQITAGSSKIQTSTLAPRLYINLDYFKNGFIVLKEQNANLPASLKKKKAAHRPVTLTNKEREIQFLNEKLAKLEKFGPLSEKQKMIVLLILTNAVKQPVLRTMELKSESFYQRLRKYNITDEFLVNYEVEDLFIKCAIAKRLDDGQLYVDMKDLPWGIDKNRMKILGAGNKLIMKHQLGKGGRLPRFDCESFIFQGREFEEIEIEVREGQVEAIKFLKDNTYAKKIARVYDNESNLINSTRKLGMYLKDLKDNKVIIGLNEQGKLPVVTGPKISTLLWGKKYRDPRTGKEYTLANEEVELTVKEGIIVKVRLLKYNILLPLTVVYEADTKKPVYSCVNRILKERFAAFTNHYVETNLRGDGTLSAGDEEWFALAEYPYYRVRYWVENGWVIKAHILKDDEVVYKKYINLVRDKKGKIVNFFRRITLDDLAKLDDHSVACTLRSRRMFLAGVKENKGNTVRIWLDSVLPKDIQFPLVGKLIIKKGIIHAFEFEGGRAEDFFYVVDKKTGKVVEYFTDMGAKIFKGLSNVKIVKKLNTLKDKTELSIGAKTICLSFPIWCRNRWVAFDLKKGGKVSEITLLYGRDHRKPLLAKNNKPIKRVTLRENGSIAWEWNLPKKNIITYVDKKRELDMKGILALLLHIDFDFKKASDLVMVDMVDLLQRIKKHGINKDNLLEKMQEMKMVHQGEDGYIYLDIKDFPWGVGEKQMALLGKRLKINCYLASNGTLPLISPKDNVGFFLDNGVLQWKNKYEAADGKFYAVGNRKALVTVEDGIIVKVEANGFLKELPLFKVYGQRNGGEILATFSDLTGAQMELLEDLYAEGPLDREGRLFLNDMEWARFPGCAFEKVRIRFKKQFVEQTSLINGLGNIFRSHTTNFVFDAQGKNITGALSEVNLDELAKLKDAAVLVRVEEPGYFSICWDDNAARGNAITINIKDKIKPQTTFPFNGRLYIKDGIINKFVSDATGEIDDINYVLDKNNKVYFYFRTKIKAYDYGLDLTGKTVVRKNKSRSGNFLFASRIYNPSLPGFCYREWMMFEVKKEGIIDEIIILEDKITRKPKLTAEGQMLKRVQQGTGNGVWDNGITIPQAGQLLQAIAAKEQVSSLKEADKLQEKDSFRVPLFGELGAGCLADILNSSDVWEKPNESQQKILEFSKRINVSGKKISFLIKTLYLNGEFFLKALLELKRLYDTNGENRFYNDNFILINSPYFGEYSLDILYLLDYEDLPEYQRIFTENTRRNEVFEKLIEKGELWKVFYYERDLFEKLLERYLQRAENAKALNKMQRWFVLSNKRIINPEEKIVIELIEQAI